MHSCLVAGCLGLEFANECETLVGGIVPVSNCDYKFSKTNFHNIYKGFSSGAPAIYVDGMLAMSTGSLAYADAISNGDDINLKVRKSLKWLRVSNKMMQDLVTKTPLPVLKFLMKYFPGFLVKTTNFGWVD